MINVEELNIRRFYLNLKFFSSYLSHFIIEINFINIDFMHMLKFINNQDKDYNLFKSIN